MDRASKQKISKETADLNIPIVQMDLTDIYKSFHPPAEYSFFSSIQGTFFRIDHMVGQETSLNTFKKIEIIPSVFSDHNGMKLEINSYNKKVKFTNMLKLNNTPLNYHLVKEEIKRKFKKYLKTNENDNTTYQNLQDAAKAVLREKFIV